MMIMAALFERSTLPVILKERNFVFERSGNKAKW
jgi:hypothetical protein